MNEDEDDTEKKLNYHAVPHRFEDSLRCLGERKVKTSSLFSL